ncbi:MAG: ABC transporter substrate-binding protein [Chloroflexota bacterium]|nr:ABC transporter substrate-binding protein [Chloroflexota bacterium]
MEARHDDARHHGRDIDIMELEAAWQRRGLPRRDFVRLILAGASTATIAGILAACGGASPTPTTAATTTTTTTTTTTAGAATTATARTTTTAGATTTRTTGTTRTGTGAGSGVSGDNYPSGGRNSTLEPVGRRGGRVTEVAFADARTTNPMTQNDDASIRRNSMMFGALLGVNPDNGLPFADLAETVPTLENGGISRDGLTYTFRLRRNVQWHDGRPFTARDVVFTYQTMQKPELGSPRTAELNERVESVAAPDDNTVVFRLKKVVAPFLTSNMYPIAPEHILGSVPVDQIRSHPFSTGDPRQTIGTGPFRFQEWIKDDRATFVKNPTYFRGEPALDQFISKVVRDANVVVAQLRTGEGDFGGITEAFFEEMSREPRLNVVRGDTYSFTFYAYQLDPAKTTLFGDKRVRQALAYALDREAMIRAIRFGIGKVAEGTMPTLSWAYAPDQIRTKYPYDPRRAEQLLEEAGWRRGGDGVRAKDGQRLAFGIWTNAGNNVRQQYITVMQQQWRQIGVDVTPRTEEWNAFLTRITETRDFEIFLVGFGWDVDPDQTSMWATESYSGGFNMNKYSNARVDQLLTQALSELDRERRRQLYIEMQNIVMDELPSLIIDFPEALTAVNKRVHNLKPNAINTRWNAHTWWVDDGR